MARDSAASEYSIQRVCQFRHSGLRCIYIRFCGFFQRRPDIKGLFSKELYRVFAPTEQKVSGNFLSPFGPCGAFAGAFFLLLPHRWTRPQTRFSRRLPWCSRNKFFGFSPNRRRPGTWDRARRWNRFHNPTDQNAPAFLKPAEERRSPHGLSDLLLSQPDYDPWRSPGRP